MVLYYRISTVVYLLVIFSRSSVSCIGIQRCVELGFVELINKKACVLSFSSIFVWPFLVYCCFLKFACGLLLKMDFNNQQNGAYYGRQGYGYAVPQNQDPNMYAGAYGASSNGYGNHQQSVS